LFTYSVFGLTIASELECDGFLAGTGKPDVTLRYGIVPERLDAGAPQGVCYQALPGQFLLQIKTIARYLVSNGDQILVDIMPGADLAAVGLFLQGAAFSAMLYQRGFLPFHGSAIATPRGAVVIAGPSGYGKSTLAAEFRRRGYAVLADELCAARVGHEVELLPANPTVMLWADTLDHLELDKASLRPARANMEKYIVPLGSGFSCAPLRLHAVYSLDLTNLPQPALIPITGLRKLRFLAQACYRPNFAESLQLSEPFFAAIAEVAPRVRMAEARRPRAGFRLRELADLIEGDFSV